MAQTSRISKNNTVVLNENNVTTVILHQTRVVTVDYNERKITFNTGGWMTATTVARMNQAMNEFSLPYCVGRAGGVMAARNHQTGEEFKFDGDELTVSF